MGDEKPTDALQYTHHTNMGTTMGCINRQEMTFHECLSPFEVTGAFTAMGSGPCNKIPLPTSRRPPDTNRW